MSDIVFRALPAGDGDCLLISFNNRQKTNILIDGGTSISFQANAKIIQDEFDKSSSNHLFITHIDDDHIAGIVTLFSDKKYYNIYSRIKGVYFNSSDYLKKQSPDSADIPRQIKLHGSTNKTSALSGKRLEEKLIDLNIQHHDSLISGVKFTIDDISFTILSPSTNLLRKYESWLDKQYPAKTSALRDYSRPISELISYPDKEDNSVTNGSSIAMLVEYRNKKILLLGDSYPSVICESLTELGYSDNNKLTVDLVKTSHHGSRYNSSNALWEMIHSPKFVISTNGTKHQLPHKQALAKIIASQSNAELLFNYPIYQEIFSEEDHQKYSFSASLIEQGGINL